MANNILHEGDSEYAKATRANGGDGVGACGGADWMAAF